MTSHPSLYPSPFFVTIKLSSPIESSFLRSLLMEKLWESDAYVDENTLSVNVNRLRKKLDSIGLESFFVTKKGLGYRLG